MKRYKPIPVLFILALLLVMMTSCAKPDAEPPANDTNTNTTDATEENYEEQEFSYSLGIDDNGYWKGIRALDYVELSDYKGLLIPQEVHNIPESSILSEIDAMLDSYTKEDYIEDRAVRDGDTVNIDYVGSIGGVEFLGGSTSGQGTRVTIGVTVYIDDFLEQLIGHLPGETFDVKVRFPENYGVDELNGKDAVFVTTVNYIIETVYPELTDAFVYENFYDKFGLETVEDLTDEIARRMQDKAVSDFIRDHLSNNVTVKSIPGFIMWYQENAMIDYYVNMAISYGVELQDLLDYMGVASIDDLLIKGHDENVKWARFCLVVQAIAEDMGLVINTEDVKAHFKDAYKVDDFSEEEEYYGLPYLKQMVLHEKIMDFLAKSAVLE